MEIVMRRIERAFWVVLSGIGLGVAILLTAAWLEYLNNPGISIVDGYWIGRMPWTPIGVWLVIGGVSIGLLAATVAVALRGDWLRRVLIMPVLALPILWWATAMGIVPLPRYRAPDPVTLAYSLPEAAALSLILPALAAAVLALVSIRPDRRAHLRPVHEGIPARTGDQSEGH